MVETTVLCDFGLMEPSDGTAQNIVFCILIGLVDTEFKAEVR